MNQQIMSIIMLLTGILLCFCGFKFQKLLITIAWFLIGYNLANLVCIYFLTDSNIIIIVSLVVGILLAGVGYRLEKLALFIAVSYLLFRSIGSYIPIADSRLSLIVKGVVSLIGGALSTLFIKPILIGVSSLAGASIIKEYLPQLITIPTNVLSIGVLVILVLGIIFQIKTS